MNRSTFFRYCDGAQFLMRFKKKLCWEQQNLILTSFSFIFVYFSSLSSSSDSCSCSVFSIYIHISSPSSSVSHCSVSQKFVWIKAKYLSFKYMFISILKFFYCLLPHRLTVRNQDIKFVQYLQFLFANCKIGMWCACLCA